MTYPRFDEFSDIEGEVKDTYEEMRAKLAAVRVDAERYRWLRDVATGDQWDYIMTTEDTDAAIDAARGES